MCNFKIICQDDKEYPDSLRKIKNSPQKLWCVGNISLLKENAISVIGSRNNTEYGKKWCEEFTRDLIKYNLTIVSGMAKGIDSIAHKTALKYKGNTIAVLPSGLENVYPKENIELYHEIIKNNGLVISEYDLNFKANKETFLERNRIVSGLSLGTLVIEASKVSGTGITARISKSEGKQVFCIPGNLGNLKSVGTNKLIQKGAFLVTSVQDIISNYSFLNEVVINKNNEEDKYDEISKDLKNIYLAVKNGAKDVNSIVRICKNNVNEILTKITMLEIQGKIEKVNGNLCIKNRK